MKEGQIIGEAQGVVSANVHASIPGRVVDIVTVDTIYNKQTALVIEADGAFSTSASVREPADWRSIDSAILLERVWRAGVVGQGGRAFPSAAKLSPPPGKRIDTLVINGTECEPYLTADDQLMQTYPEAVIEGIRIVLKILGIKRAVIGVEDNKKEAIKKLRDVINGLSSGDEIRLTKLTTIYPRGAERHLVHSLLKRRISRKDLPFEAGVVVFNVSTIAAIRDAVLYEKPLIDRYMTISGSLINNPGNYRIRTGTLINDIVNECGGLKGPPAKIIAGGPMRGIAVSSIETPVVKGMSGLLFLSEDETGVISDSFSPCIRCGKCVRGCPAQLVPCDIAKAAEKNRLDIVEKYRPEECIQCGICSYVCPSLRPVDRFVGNANNLIKNKRS